MIESFFFVALFVELPAPGGWVKIARSGDDDDDGQAKVPFCDYNYYLWTCHCPHGSNKINKNTC